MVMIPKKQEKSETKTAEKPKVDLPKASAPAPAPAAETAAETAAAPAAAPAATALAQRPTTAVAVAGRPVDVMVNFKDQFRVDWNTLARIQATNGNFVDQEENKRVIATEIVMELMSFQDNYQISPGTDDDDDIQYVRYSDDGKITTQGEDCNEYIAAMQKAGYEKCKMAQRLVLAGNIIGGSHDGKLVQINLPPTSKAQFDRFRMQVALDVARGKRTAEEARFLHMKAVPVTKGKNTWTQVNFDYAKVTA